MHQLHPRHTRSEAGRIILRYGLEHPIVNDCDFKVWRAWGVQAWPTLFIIDPEGRVVGRHSGEGVYTLFRPVIARLVRAFDFRGLLDRRRLRLRVEKEQQPQGLLSFPGKVLADGPGNQLFITDANHHQVLVTGTLIGEVPEAIGSGEAGFEDGDFRTCSFRSPQEMALDTDCQILYVADTYNNKIKRLDPESKRIETIAGGVRGWRDGAAPLFYEPGGIDAAMGRLYVADSKNHAVRVVDLATLRATTLVPETLEITIHLS